MSIANPPTEADLVRFVTDEARLLDTRQYEEWYALFAEDGYYWVPLTPGQPDPVNHTSLAYEDRFLLRLRIERFKTPNAHAQHPPSRCLHVLQRPDVETRDPQANRYVTRTPFLYTETRGDEQQIYAATAFHYLRVEDGALKIVLKRVDILNSDAALPSIQLFL